MHCMELSASPKVLTPSNCCDFQSKLPSVLVLSANTDDPFGVTASSGSSVLHSLCVPFHQVSALKLSFNIVPLIYEINEPRDEREHIILLFLKVDSLLSALYYPVL